MSDITQPSPPPPQAPAPSPPQQTQVPVNEAPVSTPSPIGDQAPPKPPGQESNKQSHIGRREAIQKAFDRAKQDQAEVAAKPRPKPTIGHNQPPEPTTERYREAGKFARDPSKIEQGQQQPAQAPPGQAPSADNRGQVRPQPLPETANYRDPPRRFSEPAKVEWNATPESVRGAVHSMARDFQGAYEKFRGDYEVMETLRPYHNLAQQQGTTLERAFTNYYQMERKLHSDMIGGLDIIIQNMKMQHDDGSPVTLRDVAHHIVNMSPEQHRMTAQQNHQTAADMRIGQLHQMVEKLTNGFQQIQYKQRFDHHRAEVDHFAETHPRLDELGDLIKQELDLGFPLPVAYARADRLRPPSNTAAQTRNTSAQTRRTSISGAPDGGKAATTRPSDGRRNANGEDKHPTRREAIAKAMRRVSNGI